ncbi:helix-turn-helix domain-containing protein [Streptomyces sp. sk2.1]|uniref:AraC-like ligand-binding domain-containing protein n=2 Tax=unclassified Streptomyces TaxID=2593676 RepID=UPI0011E6EE42|nr:helix-turn-helix domain-containing protein [Streptomyces sp. sk2.1]
MSPVMTTASVPDRDKVAYWSDAVGKALVPMAVAPRGDGPFSGRLTTDRIGCLRVSTMEADAKRVSRTPALIARSSEALVAVGIQVSGTATLLQDGRRAEVGEGDLVVYDTTRPYSFDYPERFSAHVFQVPHQALSAPDADIRQVTGTVVGPADGFGAALLPFLSALATSARSYSPVVGGKLAGGVVDLLDTLVAERTLRAPADTDTARGHLVRRVREHIDRHLGDPALSPESIARAQHISVRYLHRVFEGEGVTVGRLIQQRRLEECARELARRGRTAPTVSAVAQRWGFVNPAHFSRAFRAAYGLSPREWRSLRTDGDGAVPGRPVAAALTGAGHR